MVESEDYTCIYKGPVCHPPSATCPYVAVLVEGADSALSVTRENFGHMQCRCSGGAEFTPGQRHVVLSLERQLWRRLRDAHGGAKFLERRVVVVLGQAVGDVLGCGHVVVRDVARADALAQAKEPALSARWLVAGLLPVYSVVASQYASFLAKKRETNEMKGSFATFHRTDIMWPCASWCVLASLLLS